MAEHDDDKSVQSKIEDAYDQSAQRRIEDARRQKATGTRCDHLATRVVMPLVRWCAAVIDRDHRRHDHQRPVRFWGDGE